MLKKGSALSIVANIALVVLVIILIIIGYLLYLNIPREAQELDFNIGGSVSENEEIVIVETKQFYKNMKFNHNLISYNIESNCDFDKRDRMIRAFNEVDRLVGPLRFESVLGDADIKVTCDEGSNNEVDEKHFIAGEGGAKEIIQTGRYHVIEEGLIFLYEDSNIEVINCDEPKVELHELMHVFGFGHTNKKESLMYPFIEKCSQELDDSLIVELNRLYSEQNLADLYFSNVSVVKKGRYLNFNITIKNSGTIDSEDVFLTILDNDEVVEVRDLGSFKFGSGISIQTSNLKLKHLNPDSISFIIDRENSIREIDEDNNIANIKLK
jgi:hypothetical protein